jgi:hypothetical protein
MSFGERLPKEPYGTSDLLPPPSSYQFCPGRLFPSGNGNNQTETYDIRPKRWVGANPCAASVGRAGWNGTGRVPSLTTSIIRAVPNTRIVLQGGARSSASAGNTT